MVSEGAQAEDGDPDTAQRLTRRSSLQMRRNTAFAHRFTVNTDPTATNSGILFDFYARTEGSNTAGSKLGFKAFSELLQRKRNTGGLFEAAQRVPEVLQYASVVIDREKLQCEVLQDLTRFWKRTDHPAWRRLSRETFRTRAKEVFELKRREACLQQEVADWVRAHHPEVRSASREPEETLHERQERVRGFWSEYQTSFRRQEVPLSSLRSSLASGGQRNAHHDGPVAFGGAHSKVTRSRSTGSMKAGMSNGTSSMKRDICPCLIPMSEAVPDILRETRLPPWTPPKGDPVPPARKVMRVDRSAVLQPILIPDGQAFDPLAKRYQRDKRARGVVAQPVNQPPTGGQQSPTKLYVLECETNGIMPTPMPFITGHSLRFYLWDKVLVDNDLLAASVALSSMAKIEEANLEGNRVLTDRSLVPFLTKLMGHPAIWSLRKLSLKYCVQAGKATLDHVTSLLSVDVGASNLQHLDLGGVSIGTKRQRGLCEAIMAHPGLRSVHLAECGLGASANTRECVGCLLSSRTLQELDLAWNCFSAEVFTHLGERIVETQRLKSLCIANCSEAHTKAGDAPILYFLEHLCGDEALTHLDASLNRLSFCGGLVLEDALEKHGELADLRVSHNPLGVLGMRSLLRLLVRDFSGLLHLYCDGCMSGPISDGGDVETQIFNLNNPGGRYHLDLQRPYHRAILRMLYKSMERFKCVPEFAFTDIVYSSPPYSHASKDAHGNWLVPDTGKLQVTYNLEKGLEARLKHVDESSEFSIMIQELYKVTRLTPGFKKASPVFGLWRHIDGQTVEQLVMLNAMSKDFNMTFPQVGQLCSSPLVTSEVIRRLLHSIGSGQPSRYLTMLRAHSLDDFVKNHRSLSALLSFNIDNPTGHYKLYLSNCADHSVAEQLLLLDRWEAGIARKRGRFPVSQRGNYTQVRNETYQGRSLPVQSIDQWKMPEADVFEFDYVSGKRPPPGAAPLDEPTFRSLLAHLHSSPCNHAETINVLRIVSSFIWLDAMQLRQLLGIFPGDDERSDLFVLFFMRLVDKHNDKVIRVRFADKLDELRKLRKRLGATTLFPFIQPEQSHFELDFALHDERLCASLVVDLAAKENPLQNLKNPSYIREDGTRDPLALGVPRSWASFDKCPTGGTFKVQYECAPEEMLFDYRVKLLETYGFWTCATAQGKVMWWAALAEAPGDVLEFLEFLVGRFDDIDKPFRIIDSKDGNGNISLREFEEGLKALKCNKFKGRGESQRIANIFRYLDPNGGGNVSQDEWGIMGNLWKEMRQSILEFVQFLERTFGTDGQDVLDEAWEFIDEDGSGEIDANEWNSVVPGGLRYFGPSKIIFNFLDKDDEGTVSRKEFHALEVFLQTSRLEESGGQQTLSATSEAA